jgi:YHYH protein
MNKLKVSILGFSLVAITTIVYGCIKDETTNPDVTPGAVAITSVVQAKYTSAVTFSTSGSSIVLKSNGKPDHVSPYWGSGNALYEAPTLSGQIVNPGTLQSQVFVMTIPTNPNESSSKEATSLGPIGMALNGVAIYNDREGGNVPVDAGTLLSFDRSGAHSGPGGLYHYHFTGDFMGNNDSTLIGFLRDGYPIYARKDKDGTYPSNLDANGGHIGATTEFPNGIYHYHATNTAYQGSRFYVLKSGSYYGTKGTFSF